MKHFEAFLLFNNEHNTRYLGEYSTNSQLGAIMCMLPGVLKLEDA